MAQTQAAPLELSSAGRLAPREDVVDSAPPEHVALQVQQQQKALKDTYRMEGAAMQQQQHAHLSPMPPHGSTHSMHHVQLTAASKPGALPAAAQATGAQPPASHASSSTASPVDEGQGTVSAMAEPGAALACHAPSKEQQEQQQQQQQQQGVREGDVEGGNAAPTCWICLGGAEEGELTQPCKCASLHSHAMCLARWQLRQHGKEDEKACRFCKAPLPPWPEELQAELAKEVPNPNQLRLDSRRGICLALGCLSIMLCIMVAVLALFSLRWKHSI